MASLRDARLLALANHLGARGRSPPPRPADFRGSSPGIAAARPAPAAGRSGSDDDGDEAEQEEIDDEAMDELLANAALGIENEDEAMPTPGATPEEYTLGDVDAAPEDESEEATLVAALLQEDPKARQLASSKLWEIWYNEAGAEARKRLDEAGGLMGSAQTVPRAAAALESLASDYPAWAEPLNRLATLRFMEKKFPEAIELCEKVLAMKPGHFACLSGLTMAHYNLGDKMEARAAAERLRKLSPAMGLPLLAQLDREQLSAIGQLADNPPEMVRALCAYIMKTAGAVPNAVAERLGEGGSLLARLCNMLAALGLEEGTEQTKPMVEEYAAWLQTVYFDGVTEAEDGEALRGFSTCTPESSPQGRQLNRHVSELVETQEFAMKAQELTGGLGGQGSGVAS